MISCSFWSWGFVTYFINHLLHLILWRLLKPKQDVRLLFLCLIGLPVGITCLIFGFGHSIPLAPFFFHLLLAANYIAIYPAFQASSPTVHLLEILRRAQNGLSKEEILESLSQKSSLNHRFQELVGGRLIKTNETQIRLSFFGKSLALFFFAYRRALGLGQGAG